MFLDRPDTLGAHQGHRLRSPDYTARPERYAAFVQAEIDKFGAIIAKEGLKMDIN